MKYTYSPVGVCAKLIKVEITDEATPAVSGVQIAGGCPGYSAALSRLLVGMPVTVGIKLLHDVKCGTRQSSCAAEVSKALQACLDKLKEDKLCQ